MGQFLSQPVVEKHTVADGDDLLHYGLLLMQGWRISMEDAHLMVLDLGVVAPYAPPETEADTETEPESKTDSRSLPLKEKFQGQDPVSAGDLGEKMAFFGVFDGHGGARVALFAGEHLPNILRTQTPLLAQKLYTHALQDAFLACDRAILDDPAMANDQSGCAATTALITPTRIVCANAGDLRTVLGRDGVAKPMSYDHKPQNEGEKARIVAAGGFVEANRVNGNLALSRCLGDFLFKKAGHLPAEEQVVTAYPDVLEHELGEEDEFLIVACDGIWDCLLSQECVDLVEYGILQDMLLGEICEAIIDVCVAPNLVGLNGLGCDNMLIAIIAILQGKTLEEWYDSIKQKKHTPPKSFKEMRIALYNTEEGPEASAQEGERQDSGLGKSLSELINLSVATIQDGTYYIDASSSGSLLASLGILKDGEEQDELEEQDDHELEDKPSKIQPHDEVDDENL